MSQTHPPAFRAAARRVRRRLLLTRWLGLLGRTAAPVFITATLLLIVWRLTGGRWSNPLYAGGLILVWLVGAAAWTWVRRPSDVEALAVWDARADRGEAFLSALCFEDQLELHAGEQLHLSRERRKLDEGLGALRKLLPLVCSWMLLLPVGFFGISVSGLLVSPLPLEDQALNADARSRAATEADRLDDDSKDLDKLKELDEKEKEAVEELKASLEDAASKLKSLDKESQRDVLKELERRAREAEKLADSLGAGEDQNRQSPMVAELARHAETADFAESLRANELDKTATEATKIAENIRSKDFTLERHQRLKTAVEKGLEAADENDKRTVVGRRLKPAQEHLEKNERPKAAEEFERIAQHFTRADERKQAQRQLRRLARKLRNSGQRIFGRRLRSMERLPQRLAANSGMMPLGQFPPGQRRMFHLPPWAGPLPKNWKFGKGNPSGMAGGIPIPGQGGRLGGSCPGGGGGMIPVPGAGAGAGAGQMPGAGAGIGGLEAGVGTAPYGKTPTKPFGASSTEVVNPLLNREGDSEVRAVEGASHTEEAARKARDIAIQFLKAEEEALAEEPLPLPRREQVLRYFTALRRELEDEHR